MKNVTFIFCISLMPSCNLFAQAGLTQSMQEINKEFPRGDFDGSDASRHTYTYYNEELYCHWIFKFDKDMICKESIVAIDDAKVIQAWIQSMNEEWVIINDIEWKYYRSDGFIFGCNFKEDNDGRRVFIYFIKKHP